MTFFKRHVQVKQENYYHKSQNSGYIGEKKLGWGSGAGGRVLGVNRCVCGQAVGCVGLCLKLLVKPYCVLMCFAAPMLSPTMGEAKAQRTDSAPQQSFYRR